MLTLSEVSTFSTYIKEVDVKGIGDFITGSNESFIPIVIGKVRYSPMLETWVITSLQSMCISTFNTLTTPRLHVQMVAHTETQLTKFRIDAIPSPLSGTFIRF